MEKEFNRSSKTESRDAKIVKTSVIGITANVFLAAFKAVIGFISGSIAITLDAVNNISDAASSVITIIGTKLAAKQPNKKHPFGYGRVEYLTAMIIAVMVLYAGITALIESIKKIISPEAPDYSVITLVIIGVAVIVKLVLGSYVKSVGEKVNSDSLVNSGEDAKLDAVISAATLVAAVVFMLFKVSLEAWLGAIIAIVIIKSGVEMISDTISKLLGERADAQLARDIKSTVCGFEGVSGAYDLVLNNYGPDAFNGSVHIEVPDTFNADKLDELIREITVKVYKEHNVILSAIGVYSLNTQDDNAAAMREKVEKTVLAIEYVLEMHGFHVNEEAKSVRFDVIVSFDAPSRQAVYEKVLSEIKRLYPDYSLQITLDTDFSQE